MNWVAIFNRLFEIINTEGDTYFSGPRFLKLVRETNYSVPAYQTFIDLRREQKRSTSRRDFFYDILMEQPEDDRIQIISSILDSVGHFQPERSAAIKQVLKEKTEIKGPQAKFPNDIWNADRLNEYLERIDAAINTGNYESSLTLAYTCLEGFFKSFIREKIPDQSHLSKITPMSVEIRKYLKSQLDQGGQEYPEQMLTLISTVTNAVAQTRNDFSDSHSGSPADDWMAIYIRDNVNSLVKMILSFV